MSCFGMKPNGRSVGVFQLSGSILHRIHQLAIACPFQLQKARCFVHVPSDPVRYCCRASGQACRPSGTVQGAANQAETSVVVVPLASPEKTNP